jgi:unsaturated rhamnogalacturonyl hydrolase
MPAKSWSRLMADSTIKSNPVLKDGWGSYPIGVVLKGIESVWRATGDSRYFEYLKRTMDSMVTASGGIPRYEPGIDNIDHINNGKILLLLYRETKDERYASAARFLMDQLSRHPRTSEGGFWHKKVYPHQMWLDGIYMGSPFIAEYAALFGEPEGYDEAAKQIALMNAHARDEKTGLLYHGWDESRKQRWADPVTGRSPHFWGRAMGWYAMAIVDVMEFLPPGHRGREGTIAIFKAMGEALLKVQDAETGLWFQVLDQGRRAGNYLEASASAMFAYSFLKADRLGFAEGGLRASALKAVAGLTGRLVEADAEGWIHLKDTCRVAGLGSYDSTCPYRDGSYEYYVSEPREVDDLKGVGAFILAAAEAERL